MTSPPELHAVRARARASFLGLAVGDALGATVEFMEPAEIRQRYGVHRDLVGGGWLRLAPGRVTDDTELSLCIARAVTETGTWSLSAIAERFARWLKAGPIDVGNTCRRGIRSYILDGTLEVPPGAGDAGNGAAMRMLPVALLSLGDEALLERLAIEQSHLTHNHPLSDAACVTVGKLVQLACLGRPRSDLQRVAEELAARHPSFRWAPYRGLATGYVVDTLQTVFHHVFAATRLEDALVATVNQGGDADTTGAIAGAIAGACYGLEAFPRRWTRRMDPRLVEELFTLSDALVALSPLALSQRAPSP